MWQYKNPEEMNDRDVYDGNQVADDYVNKYTVDSSTLDLTIHNVIVNDAGEYWCVEGGGFGAKHVTKLIVTGNIPVLLLLLLCSCKTSIIVTTNEYCCG